MAGGVNDLSFWNIKIGIQFFYVVVQLLSQPTVVRNIILVGAGQETCTVDNDKQRANIEANKGDGLSC